MGLDMYLRGVKHFHTCTYEHEAIGGDFVKKINPLYQSIAEHYDIECDDDFGVGEIHMPVMYWRKANQIHKWFVDNTQGGKDKNCEPTPVTKEQLQKLLDDVTFVLEHKDPSVLPPQSGFFFGSTDIDEWYWEDLNNTRSGLEKLLKADSFESFIYQSSW